MSDAILEVIKWINDMVLGLTTNGSSLTGSMRSFMPNLYDYTQVIMRNVMMPVAYSVLALFLLLELHKIITRTEGMGSSTISFEIVFKTLFKVALCKIALDNTSLILNSLYSVSTHITSGVAGIMGGGDLAGGLNIETLRPAVQALGFWSGLICLILCFVIFLMAMFAVVCANVLIVTRFVQLFAYFAISPIPIATLPNAEQSQIGKSFLKSFASTCIQGTMIFIVLSFFPVLFNNAFLNNVDSGNIFLSLMGIMGYSLVLILGVFSAGKWANAICNAM